MKERLREEMRMLTVSAKTIFLHGEVEKIHGVSDLKHLLMDRNFSGRKVTIKISKFVVREVKKGLSIVTDDIEKGRRKMTKL